MFDDPKPDELVSMTVAEFNDIIGVNARVMRENAELKRPEKAISLLLDEGLEVKFYDLWISSRLGGGYTIGSVTTHPDVHIYDKDEAICRFLSLISELISEDGEG